MIAKGQADIKILSFIGDGVAAPHVITGFNNALEEMDCHVLCLPLNRNLSVEEMIEQIRDFAPDFAFFYGMTGIIRINYQGRQTHLLEAMEIPFACLFFDNPWLTKNLLEDTHSALRTIFVWDKVYLTELVEAGYQRVHYLPLATDLKIMYPPEPATMPEKFKCALSFVGSLTKKDDVDQWLKKCKFPVLTDLILKMRRATPELSINKAMKSIIAGLADEQQKPVQQLMDSPEYPFLCWILDMELSRESRYNLIRSMQRYDLHLYGSEEWLKVLRKPELLKGSLDYTSEARYLYAGSSINLNFSSTQLLTSVNQRVFDVPACGGFLITDYRRDLEDMFDLGKEMICYRSLAELHELIGYYADRPEVRAQIARAGREKVLARHTYVHRAQELIRVMNGNR